MLACCALPPVFDELHLEDRPLERRAPDRLGERFDLIAEVGAAVVGVELEDRGVDDVVLLVDARREHLGGEVAAHLQNIGI